jgi:hypothetical protein
MLGSLRRSAQLEQWFGNTTKVEFIAIDRKSILTVRVMSEIWNLTIKCMCLSLFTLSLTATSFVDVEAALSAQLLPSQTSSFPPRCKRLDSSKHDFHSPNIRLQVTSKISNHVQK